MAVPVKHKMYIRIFYKWSSENRFFNQGVAWAEMARLWGVFINACLSRDYVFSGFSALPIRLNGVAVTVQSRRRYGVIATRLHRNGKHFWQKTDCRHCQRAEGYPFSALIAPVSKC